MVTNVNNRRVTIQLSCGSLKLSAADGDLCRLARSALVIGSGEAYWMRPVSSGDGIGDALQGATIYMIVLGLCILLL